MGEISFGFYMFHQLILRYFFKINNKILHIENDLLIIIIVFTMSLIVSHYSFKLYETPMKNFIKKAVKL